MAREVSIKIGDTIYVRNPTDSESIIHLLVNKGVDELDACQIAAKVKLTVSGQTIKIKIHGIKITT